MPVRVVPSEHGANEIDQRFAHQRFADSAVDALHRACPYTQRQPLEILQSSLGKASLPSNLQPSGNGLVYSLISAYGRHHHLRLRPEDVWFTILTQFSFFLNAHAEELRSKFVAHEGQIELEVLYEGGNRWTVDFAHFATEIGRLIERNLIDPDLRAWIMPDFSTTSRQDEVVANIIMMGTVKKYFSYKCGITCGIPSVTLLGEKEDWEKLLSKIDKLDEYGDEPKQFARLLRPIVRRFIRSFEDPECEQVINFWQRVLDVNNQLCGVTKYTGWVTAFCFWNEDGKLIRRWELQGEHSEKGDFGRKRKEVDGYLGRKTRKMWHEDLRLSLDGVRYHQINKAHIPPSWAQAPVKINDNGEEVEAEMVAGSIGIQCSSSGAMESSGEGGAPLDTIQPMAGWWIFEKTGEAKSKDSEEWFAWT